MWPSVRRAVVLFAHAFLHLTAQLPCGVAALMKQAGEKTGAAMRSLACIPRPRAGESGKRPVTQSLYT